MKKGIYFFIAFLLMMAGVQTARAQKMVVLKGDNQIVKFDVSEVACVTFEDASSDTHEWVNLGLPSGTLWATCNIGANSPEEYGDYFAWGEIKPKSSYSWGNYKWMAEGQADWYYINKYTFADGQTDACWYSGTTFIGDGKTGLDYLDDAAFVNWGSKWQMPGKWQIKELLDKNNTTTEWTTQNGVYGRKITSIRNGNSIFLPAAGYFGTSGNGEEGSRGRYLSRTLDASFSDGAFYMYFGPSSISYGNTYRYYGNSIRPVRATKYVSSIELNYTSFVLDPNKTRQLSATITPSDAANKTLEWKSSNTSVATVSDDGLVTAKSPGSCTITCSATDDFGAKAVCAVKVSSGIHDYVDLGLPSGTLWATCNVGTDSPEEYGDYFAWGETKPKEHYGWDNYKYCMGESKTLTKYCNKSSYGYRDFTDGLTELLPEDDAATVNWSENWQMPSEEQVDELKDDTYTTKTVTKRNGVDGMLVTGRNGNSIFLPFADLYRSNATINIGGFYWLRTLYNNSSACQCEIYSNQKIYCSNNPRHLGRAVRPVRKK